MSRFYIQHDESGLRLADRFSRQHPLIIDFADPKLSYRLRRGGGKKELLARAVGLKPEMQIIDCTAGLGRDSFLLASLGCRITMIERSPVMALLLEDAINRALKIESLQAIASRLTLVQGDARHLLANVRADSILIDPMFPAKSKSAQVKGGMQFLQRFIGKDEDVQALLTSALASGCPRIVLKRPTAREPSNDPAPSFSLGGKSTRFDVFVQ